MMNIYLSFKPEIFKFFHKYNNEFKSKYKLNFKSSLDNCDTVLYLFNMGVEGLFNINKLELKQKYDYSKEIKNIKYFIKLKKKIIIYIREDGGTVIDCINDLKNQYSSDIILIIRDYILKESKDYELLSNSHYKYLISTIYPKNDKDVSYRIYNNNPNNNICFTIPYPSKTPYGWIGGHWKPYRKFIHEKKDKEIDVFYVKHFREDTYNGIYRKKLLEKLKNININNNFNLYTESTTKEIFYDKLLKSKIMISVWGIGESLIDDYFCIHNDIIVLKVNTNHIKDFYNLYEENNIFHFFNLDFSNLEEKINEILNNYDYYYKLHNKKRELIIKKFDVNYHIDYLSYHINKNKPININIPFKKNIFDFFYDKKFRRKYNINFNSSLNDSEVVLYLFNMGIKSLFYDNKLNLDSNYDFNKEIKNIKYFLDLGKKLIIYIREDGAAIIDCINQLIQKYPKQILFVMRDFLLKDKKNYNLISNNHFKYLIHSYYPKKNKSIEIKQYYNDLNKQFCFTIPNGGPTKRSFLNKFFIEHRSKKKEIDIFYVKNYRENTFNCIYRKEVLKKLINISKNNNLKLFKDSCNEDTFYKKLLRSKIMISVWGNGESLRDDNFCIHNDIIVLRVNTSHVKDFYNLYEENNLFHFFDINMENLENKIRDILVNYDYYYDLHNRKRKELIKKYDINYHIQKFSKKIRDTI